MIKQCFILLALLALSASIPFSFVSARTKNDSKEVSEQSWGNIDVQFPESEQALSCDDWDPVACGNGTQVDKERCEGWINGSQVMCGPRDILKTSILGDPEAFEGVLGDQLGGQTFIKKNVPSTSNNTYNPCLFTKLTENEARAMALKHNVGYNIFGDINRTGKESVQDISQECLQYLADLYGPYEGNACSSYGTNVGNKPYNFGFVENNKADNRPLVVLVDINEKNRLPDSYYTASPLILRITNFSAGSTDFEKAGQQIAKLANPDSIIVFGNEFNNPEKEMYCKGLVSSYADDKGLIGCGQRYAQDFASFYAGVKSVADIDVAAAPLDLVQTKANQGYEAEVFYSGAGSAYELADVVAANVYCDANGDVDACISGSDYGLGFYPEKGRKVILEFGPLIDYSSSIGTAQVQEQVKFIEDQCGVPNAHAELVTPLIKNCSNQSSEWLLYGSDGVYKTNGEIDDLTCGEVDTSGSIGPYYNPETHNPIREFWRGNYKVKLYDPATQVWEKLQQCAQHIIPGGLGRSDYLESELYCSNPSPVYKDGPSSFDVCQNLMQKMIGDSEPDGFAEVKALLPDDYITIWLEQFSPEERRQVLAIPDNKAAVKAYMIVYRDQDFQEQCESSIFRCKIANMNKRFKQGFHEATPKVVVMEFRIEGVRGAMEAQREYSNLLLLPPDQDAMRGRAFGADNSYTAACPENFIIAKEDCQDFAKSCKEYEPGMEYFCMALIDKLADKDLICSEGVEENAQFMGSKSPARPKEDEKGPWQKSIDEFFINFINFFNTAEPPTDPQPTVQTWIVADQTTASLDIFRNLFDSQLSFPGDEADIQRVSDLSETMPGKNPFDNDVHSDSAEAKKIVPKPCPTNTTNPGDCIETKTAQVIGTNEEEASFVVEGSQISNSLQRLTRTYLLPLGDGWSRFMGYDSGLTYLDEMACLYPSIVRAIGIPAEVNLKCMSSEQAERTRDSRIARGLYTASGQLAADLAALAQKHGISLPYLYAMLHIESPNIFRLSEEEYARGKTPDWWQEAGCAVNGRSEANDTCKALYCYDTCKEWPGGCYNLCVNKVNGAKRYSDGNTCRENEDMRPTTVMGMGQLEELTFGGATSLPPEDTSLMQRCEIDNNLDRAAKKIQGASGSAGAGVWDEPIEKHETIVKQVARGYCGFESPGCIEYSEDIYALYQGYAKQLEAQP